MHLFLQAYNQSDIFGKSIFWALFLLSILSWFLLIYKSWVFHQSKKVCLDFQNQFMQNKKTPLQLPNQIIEKIIFFNPFFELYKKLKEVTVEILEKNHFFIKNEQKKVALSEADLKLIESHLVSKIFDQLKILEQNLFLLSTVVTLAPFLGLLGTVWGILISFSEMAQKANSNLALSGLATALTTTVIGLVVAIPALVAYNYLKNSAKTFQQDMENFSHTLLSTIEMQYRIVFHEK